MPVLGRAGAEMLVESLRDGRFLRARGMEEGDGEEGVSAVGTEARHAPKITAGDRLIDWKTWTAGTVLTRDRALRNLKDDGSLDALLARFDPSSGGSKKAGMTLHDLEEVVDAVKDAGKESPFLAKVRREWRVLWRTVDGKLVSPRSITKGGKGKVTTHDFCTSLLKNAPKKAVRQYGIYPEDM